MATISRATVCSIREYGNDIKEYILQLDKYNYFEAGSFLLLTLEVKDDYSRWPESRNFSIASAFDETGKIKLIIKKVGKYTERIFNELKIGSQCTIKYAFGDFLLPFYDKKSSICCIAGGTGIAPILSFCEDFNISSQNDRLHVYYSFKNKEEAIGLEVLSNSVPKDQIHLYSTRENSTDVCCRRIKKEDVLNNGLDIKHTHYYICGSEDFTGYFKESLANAGAENIYTDEW